MGLEVHLVHMYKSTAVNAEFIKTLVCLRMNNILELPHKRITLLEHSSNGVGLAH